MSPVSEAASPVGCDSLATTEYRVADSGVGSDYTASLLEWLGCRVVRSPNGSEPHPAIEWADSGAMALTRVASSSEATSNRLNSGNHRRSSARQARSNL